jgi:hypothetical protein
MRQTTDSTQVFAVFRSGNVPEQGADEAGWNVAPDVNEVVGCLTISMFDEIMKSLRSTLSLR